MDTALFSKIKKMIIDSMLDRDWLRKNNISSEFITKYLESTEFTEVLAKIVTGDIYSCKVTLKLALPMMSELAGESAPEDWLMYLYQYSLGKSFPAAVTINLYDNLNQPCEIYLKLLRIISEFQKSSDDGTWQSKYPLNFLSADEEESLENPSEYKRFLRYFQRDYVYEMMKLNQEVLGHNTLDHICGVHYLALFIARQLLNAGLPVDLGRVSGSAAGHDIGKYGCIGSEAKRVPYLHYYYSDMWFKKHNITYIGHIAVNHSTWDLELENLPLESLILIYSDFRVKNRNTGSTSEMYIFNLKESFDVILNKLDNLDDRKLKRYQRVYAKLKDFENYIVSLNVNVDPDLHAFKINVANQKKKYNYSLLQGDEIIENIKYLAINHNINLMHKLRDEVSLNTILELARSEKDWKNLREYLHIFEEYSTYLTQKQKLTMLKFLYDQLINPEDDIRKQCAELIGELIAMFDEEYRKEVPESADIESQEITSSELLDEYMKMFILPDHKIIPQHREWIGYSLGNMVSSLFMRSRRTQIDDFRKIIIKYFSRNFYHDEAIELYLLETANFVPVSDCSEDVLILFKFIEDMLDSRNSILRLSALEVIYNILPNLNHDCFLFMKLESVVRSNLSNPSKLAVENYLKLKIAKYLNYDEDIIAKYTSFCNKDIENISEIFLSNLKTATDWILKKNQVELLLEYAINDPKNNGFYTAMHLCNILKVSAIEGVRNRAGEALIKIIPALSLSQRNDVAVELLRALEIEGYHFTKYIPEYLGKIILYLQPIELDELLDDLYEKIKNSGPQLVSLLLNTIGVAIENYSTYHTIFKEKSRVYNDRLVKMLGLLLNGFVNYDLQIKQVAFSVIGKNIFGSASINLERKNTIFKLIAKKILTLLTDNPENELQFLTNSAGLNHIYRYVSDFTFFNGKIELKPPRKVAFFPGTFDPFSLSHKEITRSIRDMGFEVYLQVDEFSWSKQVHPNLIRRSIINMSIADELNIYLYPEDFPTNLANPEDLRKLKENFSNSDVYIVVGSDVIINASSYKYPKVENSIHNFSHIIFERKSELNTVFSEMDFEDAVKRIEGKIIILTLSPRYEDISSTQIRNYIDENRDISNLVDPLVQKYIYQHGLYKREPQYKTLIQTTSIEIEIVESNSDSLMNELENLFRKSWRFAGRKFEEFWKYLNPRLLIIRDINNNGRILGFSAFHWIRSNSLFVEFRNAMVSEYVRENAVGRIVLIDGIFVDEVLNFENLEQQILSETLAFCLARDYDYAVYRNMIPEYNSSRIMEILRLQGFNELPCDSEVPVFVVNMDHPCVLNLDLEAFIKEPFVNSRHVSHVIASTRKRLQEALAKLYPGHLILTFSRNMIYETITRKICEENGVPTTPLNPRALGPAMCVPFGNILKRYIIPNTVTKSLHTEKFFAPDLKSNKIYAYPYYLSLENQIKMIRSFNRPVILVDDLLHKGYRMKALDPLLKKENIKVQKIITGILSGRGKELMDMQNREVNAAYFIPKLRVWFNESVLYPFIGGDILWRGEYPQSNIVPSINLILPYSSASFIRGASSETVYNLSEVCIDNSIKILSTLENEYNKLNERNLTLEHLNEVFISPKCPDHGKDINYDLNLSPSNYLLNDMELLRRLENIIK